MAEAWFVDEGNNQARGPLKLVSFNAFTIYRDFFPMGFLRSLARVFPGIRELSDVRDTTWQTSGLTASIRRFLLEDYLRHLLQEPKYKDVRHLAHFEHQVFSQHGEDGILAEIFRRIGPGQCRFVEIGVGDGLENNTAFLLSQGWSGIWIDADEKLVRTARSKLVDFVDRGRIRMLSQFVNKETIAKTIIDSSRVEQLDCLSIDIDQNTYWIWDGLRGLAPRVVVVEYNATWPADVAWKVPYDSSRTWDGSFAYGASLKAFELLGLELGYALVHCDLSGTNAFFVRSDLLGDKFVGPFDAASRYEPPRYFLQRLAGHARGWQCFASG